MRIYSKFEDYYDQVVQYDTDPKIKYIRETREIEENDFLEKTLKELPNLSFGINGLILFCGKLYSYAGFCRAGINGKYIYSYNPNDFLRNLQGEIRKAGSIYQQKEYQGYLQSFTDKKARKIFDFESGNLTKNSWTQYIDNTNPIIGDKIFRELDAPVIIAEKTGRSWNRFIINPRLNDYNFISVMDPYTAYQEIEMYLGSALAKQIDPILPITDELKAQSHGFNKWSFRRESKER